MISLESHLSLFCACQVKFYVEYYYKGWAKSPEKL